MTVDFRFLPEGTARRLAGWGTALALIDVDRRMTCAYVMNRMAPGIVGGIASGLVEVLYGFRTTRQFRGWSDARLTDAIRH